MPNPLNFYDFLPEWKWCETTTMGCLASISNQGRLGLLDHYLPWQNRFVTPLTHSMTHKTHWSAKSKFLIISSRKSESTMLNALVISILKATFLSLPLALHLSWWIISIATNTLSKIERSSINTNYSSYTHFVMIILNLFKKKCLKNILYVILHVERKKKEEKNKYHKIYNMI